MSQTAGRAPRIALIDAARGAALAAMVVYHAAWDIQHFRLADVDAIGGLGWRIFAHAIAASFLALVGVSLVLAAQGGLNRHAYLRRLGLVAASALAISLVTWIATPDEYITFGILHCIAVASVLALPFLFAQGWITALVGAAVIALPFVWRSAFFDQALLTWTGLGPIPPRTSDYVPVFPWAGAVLIGMAAARAALRWHPLEWWARWRGEGWAGRALRWSGRHSLAIYLAHQPILFALFWSVLQVTGPNAAAETASFQRTCVASCEATGSHAAICRSSCACTLGALRESGLWRHVMDDALTPAEEKRVTLIARQCRAAD